MTTSYDNRPGPHQVRLDLQETPPKSDNTNNAGSQFSSLTGPQDLSGCQDLKNSSLHFARSGDAYRHDNQSPITTDFKLTPIQKMHVVVLSGAGISAESGLSTFRGNDGLWEKQSIHDVATSDAWENSPARVLDFYNQRRHDVLNAQPNEAHRALVQLERAYDVTIITQNIDDLHERAGSSRVIHLHGEIMKARSTIDSSLVIPWTEDINLGNRCSLGGQLRPHVVLFGEKVRNLNLAISSLEAADFLIVVGTSLTVHPAAGLLKHTRNPCTKFLVDPAPARSEPEGYTVMRKPASIGVPLLTAELEELVQSAHSSVPHSSPNQ